MVRPSKRSRTQRRVFVRTPGSRTTLTFRERKPGKAVCAVCRSPLHGVPRERPFKFNKNTKSRKRPGRAYGGVLCPSCSRRKIILESRN